MIFSHHDDPSAPVQDAVNRPRSAKWATADTAAILLPMLLFCVQAALLRGWIVDDAGVSFAYARNLAHGYGLVSQPHAPPVEGYSNFLWVLFLAPFFLLHLFHAVYTPKILALMLMGLTFGGLHHTLTRVCRMGSGVSLLALLLIAAQAPVVIWCVSGLENTLELFLLVLLFDRIVLDLSAEQSSLAAPLVIGLLATAIALTRPEGILYAAAYPLALAATQIIGPRRPGIDVLLRLALFAATVLITYGLFLTFRVLYFHDLLPNTYYAKENTPMSRRLRAVLHLRPWVREGVRSLMRSVAGPRDVVLGAGLVIGSLWLAVRRRLEPAHTAAAALLIMSSFTFLLLPADWMPEFRFATAFHLFLPLFGVLAVRSLLPRALPPRGRAAVTIAGGLLVAGAAAAAYPRLRAFAADPTVPLPEIAQRYGAPFNRCAQILGAPNPSILLPDMGGTLLTSRLRVYDLGMLCDRTIARTMCAHKPAFYNYVFERIRPTFIHSHGGFTWAANLDGDPRFRRDYLPIREQTDDYVRLKFGLRMYAGDYVRRDALAGRVDLLEEMRGALAN